MIEITHDIMPSGRLRSRAVDGEETLGTCSCRFDNDRIVIERFSGSMTLTDGLIRAALNYALEHSIDKAGFDVSPAEYHVLSKVFPHIDPHKDIESIADFFADKNCG